MHVRELSSAWLHAILNQLNLSAESPITFDGWVEIALAGMYRKERHSPKRMVRAAPVPLSPTVPCFYHQGAPLTTASGISIQKFRLIFPIRPSPTKNPVVLIDESHPADGDGRIEDLAPCNTGVLGVVNSRITSKNSVSLVNEI